MTEQKRIRRIRIKAANAAMAAGARRREARIRGKIAAEEAKKEDEPCFTQ